MKLCLEKKRRHRSYLNKNKQNGNKSIIGLKVLTCRRRPIRMLNGDKSKEGLITLACRRGSPGKSNGDKSKKGLIVLAYRRGSRKIKWK